jgi:hypothetical protein
MRRAAIVVCAVAAVLAAMSTGREPQPSAAALQPAVPGSIVAAAQTLPSSVVRRDGRAVVSLLQLPMGLRARSQAPADVWRVTVGGTYTPRALRYEIFSGGRRVGFGVPSPGERSLVAVTGDRAVLSGHIVVRYGGRALPAGGVSPARRPAPAVAAPAAPAPLPSGPFAVTRAVYDLGNQVFQPSQISGKVELVADVHYPSNLSAGPFPLVLFQHGNHSACYRGTQVGYEWPCRSGWTPLPNYAGYDYIAKRLASYGFIVVSTSANGVNVLGNQVADTGMRQRGELLEKHLDLWKTWSTTGGAPFGTLFAGKVDMTRIGVMGHSRGGEGAVWNVIVDRERAQPYGIDAVLPLAPVDFTRQTLNDVPLEVMLPYCDGDVSDLQGMHFFDDSRYAVPGDPTPKGTVTVMAANHNFFNSVWSPSSSIPGGSDDAAGRCANRLTEAQQRRVASVYIVAYFRRYVGGATTLDRLWTGEAIPSSITPAKAVVTYLPPDNPARRIDLHRFTGSNSMSVSTLGGAVTATQLAPAAWCPDSGANLCVPGSLQFTDVHVERLGQGVLGWANSAGSIRFAIPSGQGDVSALTGFQFRVAVNPGYRASRGIATQDLSVQLSDAAGNSAVVAASTVNRSALAYPPEMPNGHMILNQLRFPLSAFTGVDLTNLSSVRLIFGTTRQGVIDVSDVAFTRGAN